MFDSLNLDLLETLLRRARDNGLRLACLCRIGIFVGTRLNFLKYMQIRTEGTFHNYIIIMTLSIAPDRGFFFFNATQNAC